MINNKYAVFLLISNRGLSMKVGFFYKFMYILNEYSKMFLFHSVDDLVLIWFIISFFVFLVLIISKNIYQIGMLTSTKEDARFEIKSDGKKKKKPLIKFISYDSPINKILFLRLFGVFLNYISYFIVIINVFLLTIFLLCYYMKSKYINLNAANYFLFSVNNVYGFICIFCVILLALVVTFIIYHLFFKPYFANLDKIINEKMISQIVISDIRSGKLLDVKNLKFNDVGYYNPLDYFKEAKDINQLFLGLDDDSKPIYYNKNIWNETNIQIIGKMGSGKGVLATSVFLQCYLNFNDFNVWFDPKNDEWAYSVFKNNIKSDEFYYIDLNRSACPQFNIFDGITKVELNELFVAGFGLGRSGSNADFYRIGDRKACRELSNMFDEGDEININTIMEKWEKLPTDLKENAKNFYGQLEELAELNCIQTDKGINLTKIIANDKRGMLYITGALRDENVVMLQKMLLLRIIQIIEKRDRKYHLKHINIMLDEVRYLLSKNTLESMGTIRDKKANIVYTHQSLGDLVGSSKDLDPVATQNIMLDNVGLRWIYKLDIKDSADWASDLTSETLKDVERRSLSLNDSNVEMVSKETTIFKQKANYIESSVIQNLPKRCGVLIGLDGLPILAYSSPIKTKKIDKIICNAPQIELTYQRPIKKNNSKKQHKKPIKKQSSLPVDTELLESSEGLKSFLENRKDFDNNIDEKLTTLSNNDNQANLD